MQFTYASEPDPARPNEDYAICGLSWAAVLDGATAPGHLDSGCVHDVPWLVRHLGGELARTLTTFPDVPLAAGLADAIAATRKAHEATCDLTNPDSPSATVTILRQKGAELEYLALADSPLILDIGGVPTFIADDRTAHLSDYSFAGVSAARNTPGGFYVASTLPEAAYESVQGSVPVEQVRRAALLTDGASRLVEYFGEMTWAHLLDVLAAAGPSELIARTRAREQQGAGPVDGRRRKLHDDATAVFVEWE
jgi:Protein phosphatase 2C